ncbi:unnamed protein product, partial [Ectocarpus sp. 12 AP-2014]
MHRGKAPTALPSHLCGVHEGAGPYPRESNRSEWVRRAQCCMHTSGTWALTNAVMPPVRFVTTRSSRYGTVMRLVWKTIDSPPRNWRSISKALVLVDHLVKHGAERVVADVQQHVHEIACLNEFRYVENMYDTGGGVREKSRELLSLMDNPDLIQAQRRNARDLKSQYNGYGGDMPPRLSGGSGGGSRPRHDSSGGDGGSGRNSG